MSLGMTGLSFKFSASMDALVPKIVCSVAEQDNLECLDGNLSADVSFVGDNYRMEGPGKTEVIL